MRLAISNIAWDVSEDEAVSELLHQHQMDAIDVAPGKYFPNPSGTNENDIKRVKSWWADRGIEITGMQALLFGTAGLNVFGTPEVQDAMLAHLSAVFRIGAGLGASRLVFGSPKNRDRAGLGDEQAMDMAMSFFRRVGDVAGNYGVIVCLEPNPPCYGANFMTTTPETADVVSAINHPAIRLQLDTGALTINGEDVESILQKYGSLVGHIHASEPQLAPLGDAETDHVRVHNALLKHLPHHLVSIEMLATRDEGHLAAIRRALGAASAFYRQENVNP